MYCEVEAWLEFNLRTLVDMDPCYRSPYIADQTISVHCRLCQRDAIDLQHTKGFIIDRSKLQLVRRRGVTRYSGPNGRGNAGAPTILVRDFHGNKLGRGQLKD